MRMTGRADVADDLTQETFIAAWRNLKSYRETGSFNAWLMRIALNKTRSYWRWKKLRNWISLDAPAGGREDATATVAETLKDVSREADPASAAADPVLERRLQEALAGLPERQREVLLLRAQGLELEEIGQALDIAEGTVKATLFAVKRKMQDRLGSLS